MIESTRRPRAGEPRRGGEARQSSVSCRRLANKSFLWRLVIWPQTWNCLDNSKSLSRDTGRRGSEPPAELVIRTIGVFTFTAAVRK